MNKRVEMNQLMSSDIDQTIAIARHVFELEAQAVRGLSDLLTEDFSRCVEVILNAKGRFVISGMGKSGHIGVKIAATLASTGTPSFFMHPAEAIHGDLGMLTRDDVLLAISNSGESEEIVKIIPMVKRMGITLIGMAGNPDSTLANEADLFLNITVKEEACPLQLAPTSSTTATLAMGDALAVALMKKRNFKPEDFAMFHPGGSLGRKLLTKVKDIMHTSKLPIVHPESDFSAIVDVITKGRLGLAIVMDDEGVAGLITDGDLRRALASSDKSRFDFVAKEIMTKEPKVVSSEKMAVEAESFMLENKINELLVVSENKLVGVVQLFDTGTV